MLVANLVRKLEFLITETISNAFLHDEERKVDKSGCISFMGKKYEVGPAFIGCTINVIYDSAEITELTIGYEGTRPWKIWQMFIGERGRLAPEAT